MKKIVSLLLALVMVLSLGVAAFAVDAEDANTTTTEEATPTVTIDQILEWIKGTIMPEINMDLMKEVIKQTKATIEISLSCSSLSSTRIRTPIFLMLLRFPQL